MFSDVVIKNQQPLEHQAKTRFIDPIEFMF